MSIEDYNFNITYDFYKNTIYVRPLNDKFEKVLVNILDQDRNSIYAQNIEINKEITYWFKLSIPFTEFYGISVEISNLNKIITKEEIKIKTKNGNIIKPVIVKFSKVGLGDQMWIEPSIRKLHDLYGKKIILASEKNLDEWQKKLDLSYKEFFKNNRHVNSFIWVDDIEDPSKYEIFETFPENLSKSIWLNQKKLSSLSYDLFLEEDELSINYIPDKYIPINELPNKYICINPYISGQERNWEKDQWQKLVDLINSYGIHVVSIGKLNYHSLDIKLGIDLTGKDINMSQTWHIINNSELFITFDSGMYILSHTTKTHILQLGWCIDEKLHKPNRTPENFTCVRGDCDIYCYSDPKYKIEKTTSLKEMQKNGCFLNIDFKCIPTPEKVFEKIKEIFPNKIKDLCLMSCCYNEAKILPFYLDYYLNFIKVDKIILYDGGSTDETHDILKNYPQVEVFIDKKDKMDEREMTNLRSNGWKKYRNDYKWIIVCDMDEFIYHPNLKEKLKEFESKGITIPLIEGFDMISLSFPFFEKENFIHYNIKRGIKDSEYLNKKAIFRSDIDINYNLGTHSCNPDGNIVYSEKEEIKLLQYKWLSYEYLIEQSKLKFDRLSDWNLEVRAGGHYNSYSKLLYGDFIKRYISSINVVDNQSLSFEDDIVENDPEKHKIKKLKILEKFLKNENNIPYSQVVNFITPTDGITKYYKYLKTNEINGEKLSSYLKDLNYENLGNNLFRKEKTLPIFVFSHNYLINDWKKILENQLNKIKKSGLYHKADLFFFNCYGEDNEWEMFKNILKKFDIDQKFILERFDDNFYEYYTLQNIWKLSQEIEESYILYFHLKGVWSSKNLQINTNDEYDSSKSIRNPKAIEKWRECLEYFNIERWYNCVDKLQQGYDTVGALYNYNETSPLYTGNFWWAKSKHIKKLKNPVYIQEIEPYPDKLWKRIKCEFWINTVKNNFYNLYSPKDLGVYYVEIDPNDYRDDINPLFSILTPTYKRYDDLPKAINCILNQTYNNWEMLICSDGKDDKVEELIKNYNDSKIRYFYTEKTNDHGATQRNYLTELSKGKFLIYLDDDNIVYSNLLQVLHENIRENIGMFIYKIDYDGLDHRLPVEDKIVLGKIDTLNFCVEKRFTKNAKWKNYIEHDYEIIKICESNILNNDKQIKFIENSLGKHVDKSIKYRNIVQIGSNEGYDELTKMIDKNDFLLLVEPLKEFNESLKTCYKNISKLHIENVAITDEGCEETIFYLHKNSTTLWESSLLRSHILKHFSEEDGIIEKKVKCKNINELFNSYSIYNIDILFIDAEGFDDRIIKSIDFSKYDINTIYYENYHINVDEIEKYLMSKGYKTYRNIFDGMNKAKKIKNKIIYAITSHPNYKISEDISKKTIDNLKRQGEKVILSAHCPVSIELQKSVDYFIYDKNNPLIKHDFFTQSWFTTDEYYALLNITKNDNNFNHALGVFLNYYNSLILAKSQDFDIAVCTNFDMIFSDEDKKIIDNKIKEMEDNDKKAFFMNTPEREGVHYKTIFFITNIDYFLNTFSYLINEEVYMKEMEKVGSNTNCLENFFYHTLKNNTNDLLLQEINENELFPTSQINLFSLIEYATILPVEKEPDKFVVWFSSANSLDNRRFYTTIKKNGNFIYSQNDIISKQFIYWKKIKFETGNIFDINFKVFSDIGEPLKDKTIIINDDIFDDINSYGKFIDKKNSQEI